MGGFQCAVPSLFPASDGTLAEQLKTREWVAARITSISERIVDQRDESTNPYGLGDGVKYYMLEVEDWTQPSRNKRRGPSRKRALVRKLELAPGVVDDPAALLYHKSFAPQMDHPVYPPRTTRSGKAFSSIVDWGQPIQPVVCPLNFDLPALLQQAVELDHDGFADALDTSLTNVINDGAADILNDITAGAAPVLEHAGLTDAPNTSTAGSVLNKPKRSHVHRKKERDRRIIEEGHRPPAKTVCDVIQEASQLVVEAPIQLSALPVSSCGYRAKPQGPEVAPVHSLEYYLEEGYTVLKNDGSKTFPLVDPGTSLAFGVAVAKPKDDPTFDNAFNKAFEAMEGVRHRETFAGDETHHRRGDYSVINCGVVYGPGSKVPTNRNTGTHRAAVEELLQNTHIRRLAIYASAAFSAWAPGVFKYYKERLDPLFKLFPHLKKNFDKSIFTSAAFNFGPSVCTVSHRDCMNCPFGWCAIQSLGHFDHTLGGHLVLEELKLLVEFPPTSTILIPSAVLTHANTPIRPWEVRASFTQYCAGGLFRFVDNGFMTQDELQASVSREEFESRMKEKETRWKRGLQLFSTLDELVARARALAVEVAETVEEGQL